MRFKRIPRCAHVVRVSRQLFIGAINNSFAQNFRTRPHQPVRAIDRVSGELIVQAVFNGGFSHE